MNKKDFLELQLEEIKVDMANCQLPDPNLLEYYYRLKRREIFWNFNVDEYIIEEIVMRILRWNAEDEELEDRSTARPIKIFINSNGGCLNSILNVMNIIQLSKTKVITIGMGKCYSSGGLLLLAGHERYIFDETTFLIHDGYAGNVGSTGKLMDNFEFTKKVEDRVKNFVLSHSDITKELYEENYRRDWFMTSDEIIKYKLADKIVTDLSEIL